MTVLCPKAMDPQHKEALHKMFTAGSPHMVELGYDIILLSKELTVARITYSDALVGDPVTGVLHGGVVTSLLDTTGGAAVLMKVGELMPLATLDLRIDYLRPSRPGKDVFARVECFKATRNVAFTRGVAYDEDEADPVAAMTATYMLNTTAVRRSAGGAA